MKFNTKPIVAYVPHGIDHRTFRPIESGDPEFESVLTLRKNIFKDKNDSIKFVLFYNSRNIRRKMVSDIIIAYRTFVDYYFKDREMDCALLLHTQPVDENGTNLPEVIEYLCTDRNVFFTQGLVDFQTLNQLYNIADVTICIGSNEGWGLSSTESVMAGTPVINNVTGGLQDQMRFEDEKGNWIDFTEEFPSNHTGKYKNHGLWARPVFPSNRSIQGSIPTPYIFDDRVAFEDLAVAMKKWYDTMPDFRETAGMIGREWMMGEESRMSADKMGEGMITCIDYMFDNWEPRKRFELIDTKNFKYKPAHPGILVDETKLNYGR